MKQNSLDDVIIEDQDPEEIFEILDLLGKLKAYPRLGSLRFSIQGPA